MILFVNFFGFKNFFEGQKRVFLFQNHFFAIYKKRYEPSSKASSKGGGALASNEEDEKYSSNFDAETESRVGTSIGVQNVASKRDSETKPTVLTKFEFRPVKDNIPPEDLHEFLEGYYEALNPILAKTYPPLEELLENRQGGTQALEWHFAFEEGNSKSQPDGLVVFKFNSSGATAVGQIVHLSVVGDDYLGHLPVPFLKFYSKNV